MKRATFVAALVAALTFGGVAPVSAQSHFVRGDTSGDGALSIGDVIVMLNYMFSGGVAPVCIDAGDYDDNGTLSISDPIGTLGYLFLNGEAPAAPFPYWDADPGTDSLTCKPEIVELSGSITTNTTLESDKTYKLVSGVFVETGVTLTIEPGTTILGDSKSEGFLLVNQGGVIEADGLPNRPIIFTSDNPVGERSPEDWGGIAILGNAQLNVSDATTGDLIGVGEAEGVTGYQYGGGNLPDNDESSGVLRYVRIEFGGFLLSADNELNGLGLFAVGAGTELDHIMIKNNKDDGIEWFGGTCSLKYGLCVGGLDDAFDWSYGWVGNGQFWVAQDTGGGDKGFEIDNTDPAVSPTDSEPLTLPTVSNFTLIGARAVGATDTNVFGVHLRRGAGSKLYNGIVMGWKDGVDVDDAQTTTHEPAIVPDGSAGNGELVLDYTAFYDNAANCETDNETSLAFSSCYFLTTGNENNTQLTENPLEDGYNYGAPDFRPVTSVIPDELDATTLGDFFSPANFIGGVDPNGANWTTQPWISYVAE